MTVLARLQPFLCANGHSPKLKPVCGGDHTGPACPSIPLPAIICICLALGTWKARGCIPVVRVVWGVFQDWLLSLTWGILAKLPKSEMGVSCMAASTPLLYMHPYHVAN